MRLEVPTLPTEVSSGIQTHHLRIKASRKAFEILASGIYSDKILAVIRELSTNAWDAHVAAGNTEPFEVHLPNALEPYFSVKDWGTGISDGKFLDIYTTFFDSDKDQSNDYNGCLGLGAKSPFAYVDQFTVISRLHGTQSTWSLFMAEDGVPSCAKVGEAPTTEDNGLEVRLAIQPQDFAAFKDRATPLFTWFEPRPRITGARLQFEERPYTLRGPDWGVRADHPGNSRAIMGNIAYPIRSSSFPVELQTALDWGIDLWFSLGELEFTASREDLAYTPKTIQAIKTKLQVIQAAFRDEAQKTLDLCPSVWQARLKLKEMSQGLLGKLRALPTTWQGRPIQVDFTVTATVDRYRVNYRQKLSFWKDFSTGTKAFFPDPGHYYLPDCKNFAQRLRAHLKVHGKPNQYAWVFHGLSDQDLKDSGLDEGAIRCSTLPDTSKTRTRKGPSRFKEPVLEFVPTGSGDSASYWKDFPDEDFPPGAVGVVCCRYQLVQEDGTKIPPGNLASKVLILQDLGYPVRIFGVRPSGKAHLQGLETWEQWFEKVRKKEAETLRMFLEQRHAGLNLFPQQLKTLASTNPDAQALVQLGDRYEAIKTRGLRLWNVFGGTAPDYQDNRFHQAVQAFLTKYPMLRYLHHNLWKECQASDYLDLVYQAHAP